MGLMTTGHPVCYAMAKRKILTAHVRRRVMQTQRAPMNGGSWLPWVMVTLLLWGALAGAVGERRAPSLETLAGGPNLALDRGQWVYNGLNNPLAPLVAGGSGLPTPQN